MVKVAMAEIAPFRGILYDTSRVEPSRVLAPPYDVIDDAGRRALAERDPKNCVRLILPEAEGGDRYQAAARTLSAWQDEGVLRRDERPAIYRYHQIFTSAELGGREVTRRGFIAAVRLHDYADRVILPHERTLRGPKIDRLALMRATGAHLSQIFTMYSDPSGETDRAFAAAEKTEPALDGVTDDGTRHRLWRIDDREVIGRVVALMRTRKLYIADGHHRYETMLALRDELRAAAGGSLPPMSTAEFGTLFLANMDDSGLVVLPTHRLVHGLGGLDAGELADDLIGRARAYFTVTALPGGARDAERLRAALEEAGAQRPSFAAIFPGQPDAAVLTLRADFDAAAAGLDVSPAVRDLDVTLLHGVVLERLLGIDREAQDSQKNLIYIKDTGKALERTAAGEGQVCFVMNPTRLEQVRAVADAGEVMPQKSTFFYPKIASGVVINPIRPDESLD
jgi:uncharacterized protein (DUF1015 family)